MDVWYFAEGTERRVEVDVVKYKAAHDGAEPLPREEWRWLVKCGACQTTFALRLEHGITVGPDGALTVLNSFDCPKCHRWHRHIHGGVIQP